MKFNIGSTPRLGKEPIMALAIPGAGIIAITERSQDYPFDHIELNKNQLMHLKKEIEKELADEETAYLS